MRRPQVAKCILALCLLWSGTWAQSDPIAKEWNRPTEPFRIIGNIYYVGSEGISSFLVTSPNGHILIDGGFEETAPQIIANIKTLGFDISQVKILLISHAHYDHAGGLAALKKASGARLMATDEEARLLRRGGRGDFQYNDELTYPAVKTDRLLQNGDYVRLGENSLQALVTPGHTKGATTFLMTLQKNGQEFPIVFASSISAPDYKLIGNERYPDIVSAFRRTFKTLERLDCSVFLTFHTGFFRMAEKRALLTDNGPNPFVDSSELKRYVNEMRGQFEKNLSSQGRTLEQNRH